MSSPLPNLTRINPPALDIDCQPVYASAHNLTGYPLYRHLDCYLHPDAAAALGRAVTAAGAHQLRLRILDAFRPLEAQFVLFAACPDPVYMADPRTGSHHNRGVAVDLTLIDAKGAPLPMGTDFDTMSPLSAHSAPDFGASGLADHHRANRALLKSIMIEAGFDAYDAEWWHYQLPNAANYPLIRHAAMLRPEIAEQAAKIEATTNKPEKS